MSRIAFHPEYLYTLATLFGVKATDFQHARVLELGCGSARDLLACAAHLPETAFTGIDISDVAIEEAQKNADALKLKNLTLQTASLSDLSETTLGQFDYIIAHNVLSSVSEEMQDKLFEVIDHLLSPNGIAYISYNTLPGWNMAKSIRDMAQYHTENCYIPSEKALQTRALMSFLRDNIPDKNSPYGALLNQEIGLLKEDEYLFSNYLGEYNQPYYFHEFMKKAKSNRLQYLADTAIETMFVGNFSEAVRAQFQEIANDLIKTEQYLDFLTNRRYRSTLLCRSDININRNLTKDSLEGFYLSGNFQANVPLNEIEIHSGQHYTFSTPSGIQFNTNNAIELTLMKILIQTQRVPVTIQTLYQTVQNELSTFQIHEALIREVVSTTSLRLLLAGAMNIHASSTTFTTAPSEKPIASTLARFQAKNGNMLTSELHENVAIDDFGRILVQYLDGSNDQKTLTKKMMAHFERNELKLSLNGQPTDNPTEIKKYVKETTENLLKGLAANALLVE